MILSIDFNNYKKIARELSLATYLLLQLIYEKKDEKEYFNLIYDNLQKEEFLKKLENKGWIKIIDKEIHPRQKLIDLFENKLPNHKKRAEKLVDSYRECFPTGYDQYGRYRGDKQGCLTKLTKFIKDYGKLYSDKDIIDATIKYVKRYKNNRYQGMTRAHYFIEKNKVSLLLSELENLEEDNELQQKKSLNKMM